MKNIFLACYCVCLLLSCAKKTVPAKPNAVLQNNSIDTSATNEVTADTATVSTAIAVLVVADGYGRLITSKQNLPQDGSIKYNSLQLSKGFTTQQRANLQARYHTVPPRVLYVSEQNSLHSLKGLYYIYRKKFWYWKKSDGLFYLDQKYYL